MHTLPWATPSVQERVEGRRANPGSASWGPSSQTSPLPLSLSFLICRADTHHPLPALCGGVPPAKGLAQGLCYSGRP